MRASVHPIDSIRNWIVFVGLTDRDAITGPYGVMIHLAMDTAALLAEIEAKRKLIRERDEFIAAFASETDVLRREVVEATRQLVAALGVDLLAPAVPDLALAKTSTEMAEWILREAGHPLHVNEIMSGIDRKFSVSVKYATLVGNISRMVAKGKTFERAGRNVFGLLQWREDRQRNEEIEHLRREGTDLFGEPPKPL